MNENDGNKTDKFQVKSRPRPGYLSGNAAHSIIAPPPTTQRRNSALLTDCSSPDLISFTSPPPTNKLDLHL